VLHELRPWSCGPDEVGADSPARALGLVARGRAHEAADLLLLRLQAEPRDVESLSAIAQAFIALGLPTKAAAALRRAAALRPGDAPILAALGSAYAAADLCPQAEAAYRAALRLSPDLGPTRRALAELLRTNGRPAEAAAIAAAGLAVGREDLALRGILVMSLFQDGRRGQAVREGEVMLVRKDAAATRRFAEAGAGFRLDPGAARPRGRDVVAFSLFGRDPLYLEGAVENARLVPRAYPGWSCRFYVDGSVPGPTVDALRSLGAEVAEPSGRWRDVHGALWRFAVADDPTVRRFACRDADSRVGARDARAVEAWTASGRLFHLMRDHPCHAELVLAGLWGGHAGVLPPMERLMEAFPPAAAGRWSDQAFAAEAVWPLIRGDALVHDSCWRLFGAVPFPPGPDDADGDHVGRIVRVPGRVGGADAGPG